MNPYENLMRWVVAQDPAQPHTQELMKLIEDAALQEARIGMLEDQLDSVSRAHQAALSVLKSWGIE